MQSNTSWARVALWGVLGFPVLIGQADVAMGQQRLVTSGSSSSLAACLTTVQQQVPQTVTTPAPTCTFTPQVPNPSFPSPGQPACIPGLTTITVQPGITRPAD